MIGSDALKEGSIALWCIRASEHRGELCFCPSRPRGKNNLLSTLQHIRHTHPGSPSSAIKTDRFLRVEEKNVSDLCRVLCFCPVLRLTRLSRNTLRATNHLFSRFPAGTVELDRGGLLWGIKGAGVDEETHTTLDIVVATAPMNVRNATVRRRSLAALRWMCRTLCKSVFPPERVVDGFVSPLLGSCNSAVLFPCGRSATRLGADRCDTYF